MSIIDNLSSFSRDQAVTGSAASTDDIDLGAPAKRALGSGQPLWAVFHIKSKGSSGTNISFSIQAGATSGAGTKTVAASPVYSAEGDIPERVVVGIPHGVALDRYVRAYYTVSGTSALVVDAFLTDQEPYDHTAYPAETGA